MFVERMEVLDYHQMFGVESSTFPGFTNTETSRKLIFGLYILDRRLSKFCDFENFEYERHFSY